MEPKYRYRYPPCPSYDVACVEAWLEHMAQKGLHIDGASGFFAGLGIFVEGAPASVRYRLEAVTKPSSFWDGTDGPADAALDLAEELGWEYVCRWQEFDIYRTADPLATELNTDPEIQAQSLKAVEKRLRGAVHTTAFWAILYPLLRSLGPLLTATHIGAFLTLWGWGLLFAQLWLAIYRVWFLAQMRRALQRGEVLPRPNDLRRRWLRYRLGHWLHLAVILLFFVVVLTRGFGGVLDYGQVRSPLADFPGDPPFPTIADFGPADAAYEGRYFGFNDDENTFARWATLPVHQAIVWEENAVLRLSGEETLSGGLYVEYYEAKTQWMAQQLARGLFRRDRCQWGVEEIVLPELGLDYARGTDRVFTTVVLQEGNRLLRAYFYNTGSQAVLWTDWVAAMAESLRR